MKRRAFFKFFAAMASVPVLSPLVRLFGPSGFTHYAQAAGLRVISTPPGLTANDDLFGSEINTIHIPEQCEEVSAGVRAHLDSGLSLHSPADAIERVQADIRAKAYTADSRRADS